MKNNSPKYPFPRLGDEMFDSNKDGKLDTFETIFRDAHIEEMKRKAEEDQNSYFKSSYTASDYSDNKTFPSTETPIKSEKNEDAEDDGIQVIFTLISIIVLVAGLALAVLIEGSQFIDAVILFGAVAIAIALLRFAGVYKG